MSIPPNDDCDTFITPTILPGTRMWDGDRLILGVELLALEGFPMNRYPAALRIPNVLAADLAGNAFCGPVYAAVLLGLLAALPSKSLASLRTDAELKEAALGALNLARLANVTPVDDVDDGCEICVSVDVV